MESIMKLLTFGWMKGYRTVVIILIVAAGWAAENLFGIDIPNITFDTQTLLLALGVGTAATHKVA